MSETKREVKNHGFRIYRARKTNDGAASSWAMKKAQADTCLFLEVAKQNGALDANGNATFAWNKFDKTNKKVVKGESVLAKLGLADIGELLLVLNGNKKAAGFDGKGLFHQNKTGSTTISFSTYEKEGNLLGYTLSLSSKNGQNSALRVGHIVSLADAELLKILLENTVLQICNW